MRERRANARGLLGSAAIAVGVAGLATFIATARASERSIYISNGGSMASIAQSNVDTYSLVAGVAFLVFWICLGVFAMHRRYGHAGWVGVAFVLLGVVEIISVVLRRDPTSLVPRPEGPSWLTIGFLALMILLYLVITRAALARDLLPRILVGTIAIFGFAHALTLIAWESVEFANEPANQSAWLFALAGATGGVGMLALAAVALTSALSPPNRIIE